MNPSADQTLTARWLFPVGGPPLPRGTVSVRGGRVAAVEPHGVRPADLDLGNAAIIPGLVNSHTHLDLSGARGLVPPTDPAHFTDWLRGVIAYRRGRTPEQTQADIRAGLSECLAAGTTLVGDIAADGASWDAVAGAATRAVVFWELIGLDVDRLFDAWQRYAVTSCMGRDDPPIGMIDRRSTPTCRWSTSLHAPYSVNVEAARSDFTFGRRLATHVAESPAERDLLELRTGPFVEFLSDLGVYQESALASSAEEFLTPYPYNFARNAEILLIHGNYLPADFPFRPQHTVVYCPRTHAAFGHPPHPFRDFLARGVRVCLGTDSLASNPDLDLLAEARFVYSRYPDFPTDTLLRMVTLSGAEALGWADEAGSLDVGKSADLVAVPLPDRDAADPHELLFAADAPAGGRRTMFRGMWRP